MMVRKSALVLLTLLSAATLFAFGQTTKIPSRNWLQRTGAKTQLPL